MTVVLPVESCTPEDRQEVFHPGLVVFRVPCWEEKLRKLENPGTEAAALVSGLLGCPPLTQLCAAGVQGPADTDDVRVGLCGRKVLHGDFLIDLGTKNKRAQN